VVDGRQTRELVGGKHHAGCGIHRIDHLFLRALVGLRVCLRPLALKHIMGLETGVLLTTCALLLVYLCYALLRPEKF
jgi:K+-transporting ATPase KdpF subunit